MTVSSRAIAAAFLKAGGDGSLRWRWLLAG